MKILMVCLGNICRSPMAEGIMRRKILLQGLQWEVESAGTVAYHIQQPPDIRAQNELAKYKIDISGQRARKFSPYMFASYDLIFTMDAANYNDVLNSAATDEERNKVHMIMNMKDPGRNTAVPDPYYDDNLYTTVYEMLDAACDCIIAKYNGKPVAEKNSEEHIA